MSPVHCPALFLTAPASGQGKTTLTAALARLLTQQGKTVRIFKTGPDYLDPQILALASKQPVVQLDLWMAGEAWCQQQLYLAAKTADLILIEGAMGMFDGEPSSADLAARFNIPMVIVMDVSAMAQTAAALASGLASFRDDIDVVGLIANYCASERHRQLIEQALPEQLPLLATINRSESFSLPERHLGLVQTQEMPELIEQCIQSGADYLASLDIKGIIDASKSVTFTSATIESVEKQLTHTTIAVANDVAFSFIYEANVQLLQAMGAEIVYFSPINDARVPTADALWLPGGYPELHAKLLSENITMLASIKQFFNEGKKIVAECGGLLYTLQTLTNIEDEEYHLLGLLKGKGLMRERGGCQGLQTATVPEGDIRGHAHHRSHSVETDEPMAYSRRQRHSAPGEAIYRDKGLTASYLHLFFPSNPQAVARLFKE